MKAKRLYKVPLADRALEILHRCKTLVGGSEFIFPGRSAKKPLSNMVFLVALRRIWWRCGVSGGVVAYLVAFAAYGD